MLGRWLILLGGGLGVYAAFAAAFGGRRTELVDSARRALVAAAASLAAASGLLWYALFSRDFSLEYVAAHVSTTLQPWYTFSAFWAGMDGSMLLWCLALAGYAAAFAARRRVSTEPFVRWAIPPLGLSLAFFSAMTAFATNPFRPARVVVLEGRGINPLLHSPGMLVHPPLLYLGYTGLAVPLAVAISALVSGRMGPEWVRAVRRWTLVPWLALGAGMVVGGAWAYTELGWGGYWGWDPVENAALLPWLAATAFLHSAVVEERRGMLRTWNVFLVLAAADLAVFGTFLTRSGLLSSVHTFTESPLGRWFFLFLAAQTTAGLALLIWRSPELRAAHRLDATVAKEPAFLVNNLLFVGAAACVLWGTVLPLVTEAVTGHRLQVGPPFFNRVMSPLGTAILLLAAVGPVVPWRRGRLAAVARRLARPATAATAASAAALLVTRRPAFAGLVWPAMLAAATAAAEVARLARGGGGLRGAAARSPRRVGGYLVHLGVAVMAVGFAGSLFRTQADVELRPGQAVSFAGYRLAFRDLLSGQTPDKEVNLAVVDVFRGGRRVAVLRPQLNFHRAWDQPQSEIAVRTTPADDLYVTLTGLSEGERASFRLYANPLVFWVWVGGALATGGGLVALGAGARRRAAGPAAPAPREEAVAWRP